MPGSWSVGWSVGDILTSSEFKKGMGSIYDTTLGAGAASIDVSGLPTSYGGLLLEIYGREDTAVSVDDLKLRFNNDSGANYDYQNAQANNTTQTDSASAAQTSAIVGVIPGASATASFFGGCMIWIPNYAGTTGYKPFVAISYAMGTAAASEFIRFLGGQWRSTSAINRITILPGAGNLITGTRLTIRAMGA